MTNFYAKAALKILTATESADASWGIAEIDQLSTVICWIVMNAKDRGNGKLDSILDLHAELFEAADLGDSEEVLPRVQDLRSYCFDLVPATSKAA